MYIYIYIYIYRALAGGHRLPDQTASGQTIFSQKGRRSPTFCNSLFYARMSCHMLK